MEGLDPLFCGPGGVHFPTLDGPFDHDIESGTRKSLDVETERVARTKDHHAVASILASGRLWNPRKSPYTILCAFFCRFKLPVAGG